MAKQTAVDVMEYRTHKAHVGFLRLQALQSCIKQCIIRVTADNWTAATGVIGQGQTGQGHCGCLSGSWCQALASWWTSLVARPMKLLPTPSTGSSHTSMLITTVVLAHASSKVCLMWSVCMLGLFSVIWPYLEALFERSQYLTILNTLCVASMALCRRCA